MSTQTDTRHTSPTTLFTRGTYAHASLVSAVPEGVAPAGGEHT